MDLNDSSNIVLLGGSFESCARPGAYTSDPETWCIRIRRAGYNGAAGLLLYGVHFETNGGDAEVWIDHGDHPAIYQLTGCDFVRNGNTVYPTNNVLFNTTGVTKARLQVFAGFRGVNGYVPDVSRKYVEFGSIVGSKHSFDDEGSLYESDLEVPVFDNLGHRQDSHKHGFVIFGPTATIFDAYNVFSVTKNSTGRFTIIWTVAVGRAVYPVKLLPGTDALTMIKVSQSSTQCVVEFVNAAGTPTDPTFEVGIEA